MLSNLVEITINNWEKYNERADRKNYTWFRFLNNFFVDPKIYLLEPIQKLVLVFLFCEASKQGGPHIVTSASQVKDQCGCDEEYFFNSLKTLDQLAVITTASCRRGKGVTAKPRDIMSRTDRQTLQTDTTDRQTETRELVAVDPLSVNSPNELVSLWHEHCPTLAKIGKLTDARKSKINARIKSEPSKAYWETLFKKISATPFLTGASDSGTWKANFDWILKNEDNAAKVLEGNYDRSGTRKLSNQDQRESQNRNALNQVLAGLGVEEV